MRGFLDINRTRLPASRSSSIGPKGRFLFLTVRWGGGLFDYSDKPGPDLLRFRLCLVLLVTRLAKARFCQVGEQV